LLRWYLRHVYETIGGETMTGTNTSFKDGIWVLSDLNLVVEFNEYNKSLIVRDQRVDKIWEQMPFGNEIGLSQVTQNGNVLILALN